LVRDAADSTDDVQAVLARRAERETRAASKLGRLESMMLAEITQAMNSKSRSVPGR
jgi:hypothetical protein